MKKLLVLSAMVIAMPLAMLAQDDDMYFVPTKKSKVKEPKTTYYAGSNRDVDEYNRRGKFRSKILPIDSLGNPIIDSLAGVYPDTIHPDTLFADRYKKLKVTDTEDYCYSRMLDRWYGCYNPWFYSYYRPWYSPWYDPFYAWYDPWYGPWPSPWYDPWFDPFPYHPWIDPWHGPWYRPYPVGPIIVRPIFNSYGIAGSSNHGAVRQPGYGGSGRDIASGRFSGARRSSVSRSYSSDGSTSSVSRSVGAAERRSSSAAQRFQPSQNTRTTATRQASTSSYTRSQVQHSSSSFSPRSSSSGSYGGGSGFSGGGGGGFSGGGHSSGGHSFGGGGGGGGSFGHGRR